MRIVGSRRGHDGASLGLSRAGGAELAVAAGGVHGGGEILGSHPGARRAELLVRDERRRVVGRCLRLHLRAVGLARAGLDTQLDKLGPAGLRWFVAELVGPAVLAGALVDTELWPT